MDRYYIGETKLPMLPYMANYLSKRRIVKMIINVKNCGANDVIDSRFVKKLGLNFVEDWYLYMNLLDREIVNEHIGNLINKERFININVPQLRCIDENDAGYINRFFNDSDGFTKENYYYVNQWFAVVKTMILDETSKVFELNQDDVKLYREKFVNFDRTVVNEVAFVVAQSYALGSFLSKADRDRIIEMIKPENYDKWNALITSQDIPAAAVTPLLITIQQEETIAVDEQHSDHVIEEEPQVAPQVVEEEKKVKKQPRNAIKFEKLVGGKEKKKDA